LYVHQIRQRIEDNQQKSYRALQQRHAVRSQQYCCHPRLNISANARSKWTVWRWQNV